MKNWPQFLLPLLLTAGFVAAKPNRDFKKGEVYYSHKKFAIAEDLLLKSLEKNPFNHKAYFYLGNIYVMQDNFPAADKNYQKAIDLNTSASYYYNYGMLKFLKKMPDLAEPLFLKALELDPKKYIACDRLATIYINQFHYEKAITSLSNVLKIFPAHPDRPTILAIIARLAANTGFARQKRAELASGAGGQNGKFQFDIDLDKIGRESAIESKSEEPIKDVDIELDIIEEE